MTATYRTMQEWWQAMLDAQRRGQGFDLTMRELCVIWNVSSTNTVRVRLQQMTEAGFVRTKGGAYRAKDESEIKVLLPEN